MQTVRIRLAGWSVVLISATWGGCAQDQNFDWLGLGPRQGEPQVARSGNLQKSGSASAGTNRPLSAEEARAREVDERVDRYVRSIGPRYDPSYEGNDFQSKIRRQSDPSRKERIRQTAAMIRETPALTRDRPPRSSSSVRTADEVRIDAPEAPIHHDSAPLEIEELQPARQSASPDENALALEQPSRKKAAPAPHLGGDKGGSSAASGSRQSAGDPPSGQEEQAGPAPVVPQVKVLVEPETLLKPPDGPREEAVRTNEPPPPSGDTFKGLIRAQEAVVAKDSANVAEQFKLRMMYLLDGREDRALEAIPGADAETQEIVLAQVRSLITAKSTAQKDPAAWANKQLEALENLRGLVRAKADLKVPAVVICNAIEGYGRYTPIEPPEFKAGQQNLVLVYIEVDNFGTEKTSSGLHRTLLSVRQSLLNKAGEELWSSRDENIEDLARQQRRDFYLTIGPLAIPKSLGPGEYLLKVEVEDMLAGKINGNSARFKLIP